MRLLVTGASRGLGRSLAEGLADAGHDVRAMVRGEVDRVRLAAAWGPRIAVVGGDVTDASSLDAALADRDGVVHAAALVGHDAHDAEFERVNIAGSEHVWRACARHGVKRAVYISSVGVYARPDARQIAEDGPFGPPLHAYGRTKRAADALVHRLGRALGVHTVCLRPSVVWGPYDTHFVPRLARAIGGGRFVFVGDPDRPFSLVAAEHVVACTIAALTTPEADGLAFNVADGELPSWRQIAAVIADALAVAPPTRRVPRWFARLLGSTCDALRATRWFHPPRELSRFAVEIAGLRCTHAIDRATRILGYDPRRSFVRDAPPLVRKLLAG